MSDSTAGASIYYTLDGSVPTTSSRLYAANAAPILTATTTVNAIATAAGYTNSAQTSGLYTITVPVTSTPTFSPAAGTYTSPQTVTISAATSGATIHYTLDGSTPTAASPIYSSPITVSASETIKAYATLAGNTDSSVSSATYTINLSSGISGALYWGQKAVSGAHVYLLAANTTGYGGKGIAASSTNASLSLLSSSNTGSSDSLGAYVLTDVNGNFTVPGASLCSAGQQLYLYATGGNSGSGTNSSSSVMAALGSCPATSNYNLSPISAKMNEVTTVAAAYALAGFATDATHISSSGTALARTGIANAFANAANLASIATGAALSTIPAGTATAPQATVNTLANILSSCTGNSSNCPTLFSNAESAGLTGTPPTETATAAINIAHNPGTATAALFALQTGTGPFSTSLSAKPSDFTLKLNFTGGNGVAIDAAGNAWFVQGGTSTSSPSVVKLSSTGVLLSGSAGYTLPSSHGNPYVMAFDTKGNAWFVNGNYNNTAPGTIIELSSTGSVLSGSSGFTGGGAYPQTIALDSAGDAWVAISDTSVDEFSAAGTILSGLNGFSIGSGFGSTGVAIDGSGNTWVSAGDNYGDGKVVKLSNSGTVLSGTSGYTGGGLSHPYGNIAIDAGGNVWVVNTPGSVKTIGNLTKLSSTGVPLSGSAGFTFPGTTLVPLTYSCLAIDGAGNVWVANGNLPDVLEFSNSGTPIESGYNINNYGAYGLAVDGSGNLWTQGETYNGQATNYTSEVIGISVPVVTPIAAGAASNTLGTRP